MSQLEMVNANIRHAAKVLELGPRVEKLILNPNREVKVEVAIESYKIYRDKSSSFTMASSLSLT